MIEVVTGECILTNPVSCFPARFTANMEEARSWCDQQCAALMDPPGEINVLCPSSSVERVESLAGQRLATDAHDVRSKPAHLNGLMIPEPVGPPVQGLSFVMEGPCPEEPPKDAGGPRRQGIVSHDP